MRTAGRHERTTGTEGGEPGPDWADHVADYTSGRASLRETAVRCRVGEVDLVVTLLRLGLPVDADAARRAFERCRKQIADGEAMLDGVARAPANAPVCP